jgi:hypothetical protein
MAWEGPVLGAGLRAVLWAIARYRRYRQGRRKVSVLVHHAFFMDDVGASPLTTPPNMVVNWSMPATGTGGVAVSGYYFMKVTNLSADRDIEVTHARFIGADRDFLLTRRQLPVRLAPDKTWEGWLNAATLAHVPNVECAGRVSVTGIRSRSSLAQQGRSTDRAGRRPWAPLAMRWLATLLTIPRISPRSPPFLTSLANSPDARHRE